MGLFGKLTGSRDKCVTWLEKVDTAYINALRLSNPVTLEPYFSRRCLSRVVEVVRSNRDNLCGLERYRMVTYTLQDKSDQQLVYVKAIRYKDINMGYGVTVPMGSAHDELWTVDLVNGGFIVSEIKGAQL